MKCTGHTQSGVGGSHLRLGKGVGARIAYKEGGGCMYCLQGKGGGDGRPKCFSSLLISLTITLYNNNIFICCNLT